MRIIIGTAVAFAGIATALAPPYPYHTNTSSQDASSTIKLSTNTTSTRTSNSTISSKLTSACAVNTVTAYATPVDAKASSTAAASPTVRVGQLFGYSEGTFRSETEEDVKLQPCNHWNHNAKDPRNLIPSSVGEKTNLYYAQNGNPRKQSLQYPKY